MDRLQQALVADNLEEFTTCLQSSDFKLDRNDRILLIEQALVESKINFIEPMMMFGGLVSEHCIRHAIYTERVGSLEVLLKYASDECKRKSNALCICIFRSRPHSKKMLELLLKNGYDIYINDDEKMHPLLSDAIETGNTDVIETLLLNGANPFLYASKLKLVPSLIYVFRYSLSKFHLELIIKYAVLHLHSKERKEINKFLHNFRLKRAFRKFAESCIAEANFLRDLDLNSNKLSLFDFVVSQGLQLKLCIDNLDIIKRLFLVLASTPLPIYKREILKKIGRNCILSSFHYLSHKKFYVIYDGKKVFLAMDCVESICKFLSMEDIISMWIAFFSI